MTSWQIWFSFENSFRNTFRNITSNGKFEEVGNCLLSRTADIFIIGSCIRQNNTGQFSVRWSDENVQPVPRLFEIAQKGLKSFLQLRFKACQEGWFQDRKFGVRLICFLNFVRHVILINSRKHSQSKGHALVQNSFNIWNNRRYQ